MEKVVLGAQVREEKGKEKVKKLRDAGTVPAVCYKSGKEALNIKVNGKELYHALHTKAGANVLITLKVEGDKQKGDKLVLIKEIQTHPVKGDVIHIDFNEVSLTEKIKVKVEVAAQGEAKAVNSEGGVIDHAIWEVEVECLPTNIPGKIFVDISEMKIGDAVHIKDLKSPEGTKILGDGDMVVLVAKHASKLEEVVPAPGEEAAEPEVIAKGKKEEEGEEGAAPAAGEGAKPQAAAKEEKK